MARERSRTLNYRKAFFKDNQGVVKNLQQRLNSFHLKFKTLETRRVVLHDQATIQCCVGRSRKKRHELHLVRFEPGEAVSVLPIDKLNAEQTKVEAEPPPAGAEYVRKDFFAVADGNHFVYCGSLPLSQFSSYFLEMQEKAGAKPADRVFRLEKWVSRDAIKLLDEQGVKTVDIDASMFAASARYESRTRDRRSSARDILANTGRGVLDFVWGSNDDDLERVARDENLTVGVSIGVRRGLHHDSRENLRDIAKAVLEDDEADFSIVTGGGQRIEGSKMVIRDRVNLPARNETVSAIAALEALHIFLDGIFESGAAEY